MDPALTFQHGLCMGQDGSEVITTKKRGRVRRWMLGYWESTWQRICFTFTGGWARPDGRAAPAPTPAAAAVRGTASTLPGGDGGVRRCTLLGSRDCRARSRGQADESALRAAIREVEQE